MNNKISKLIFILVFSFFCQIIVFNQIKVFKNLTPYFYILYFILLKPGINRYLFMSIAFAIGFLMDLFMYTGGIHALACVFLAYIRLYLIKFIFGREEEEIEGLNIEESSIAQRFTYLVCIVFLHHFILFIVENFQTNNLAEVFLNILLNSILTITVFLIYFGISSKRKLYP